MNSLAQVTNLPFPTSEPVPTSRTVLFIEKVVNYYRDNPALLILFPALAVLIFIYMIIISKREGQNE